MSTPHASDRDDDTTGGFGADGEKPLGGDEATEEQLDAANAAEEQMLKTLDPDNPAA